MSQGRTARRHVYSQGSQNEQVVVRYTVELPEHISDQYSEQAIARNMDVELLIEERLRRCAGQRTAGLYFDDEKKRRLDRAIGHNVSDAEGVLQRLEHLMALQIEDVMIELESRLIQRLASRAKSLRKTFGQYVREEVVGALRRTAGIDPA